MADDVAPLHLVLGDEELLVERAVSKVVADVHACAGGVDVPVDRLRAGDASAAALAELLSPSLFAEDRVVVLAAAAETGKDAATLIADTASAPPAGAVLIVLHSGGGRAKALVPTLRNVGAVVHNCAKVTKHAERAAFVRDEFRTAGVRVSAEVVHALIEAIGSDLRELASACSQLVADTGGRVNEAAVRRYHSGRAEITGFDVADLVMSGDARGAVEALRWAMIRGVPPVLLADALADTAHAMARVVSAGRGDSLQLASRLGMPPWKIKKARAQARGWSTHSIGSALAVVAQLNADVKGQAADTNYALERAVRTVLRLRPASRRSER